MRKHIFLMLSVIIFLNSTLFGCALLKKKIDKNTLLYPKDTYLTATGIGNTENEAKNRAIAELSQIFESQIMSDTKDITSATVNNNKEEYKQQIESTIQIISRVALTGVEIPTVRFDQKKKLFYAISVLDKKKATDEWLSKRDAIDSRIEGRLSHIYPLSDSLTKFISLKEIIPLWVERETLSSRLRVVSTITGANPPYNVKKIFRSLSFIQSKMTVFITIEGDQRKEAWEKIAETLSLKKILVTKTKKDANVLIKGSVQADKLDIYNPGWKYARVNLSLTITDIIEDNILGEITDSTREAQPSHQEAVRKAMRKLYPKVHKKLISFFNSM